MFDSFVFQRRGDGPVAWRICGTAPLKNKRYEFGAVRAIQRSSLTGLQEVLGQTERCLARGPVNGEVEATMVVVPRCETKTCSCLEPKPDRRQRTENRVSQLIILLRNRMNREVKISCSADPVPSCPTGREGRREDALHPEISTKPRLTSRPGRSNPYS